MKKLSKYIYLIKHYLAEIFMRKFKLILDYEWTGGYFSLNKNSVCDFTIEKDVISRKYIFGKKDNLKMKFLDVGGSDGTLKYLLGKKANGRFFRPLYLENRNLFDSLYEYYGTDLNPISIDKDHKVLLGDICDQGYISKNQIWESFFDIVYSNNVFEHLRNPFMAMKNIDKMLKVNGLVITIAPFSARYHQSPHDYFRFTHEGLEEIIKQSGEYKTLVSGYDISMRRHNIQGKKPSDVVPVDRFGGWRENWNVINISMKLK